MVRRQILILATVLIPATALAQFDDLRSIPISSAATLEEGTFIIGIFSPTGYGINDDLTLFFHPILELLLTPNAVLRWRFLSTEKMDFSLQVGYIQNLNDFTKQYLPAKGHIYSLVTYYARPWISLTGNIGYVGTISPFDHGIHVSASISLLFSLKHLITISVMEEWYKNAGFRVPYGEVVYTRAFEVIRIGLGLAFGSFPLAVGEAKIKNIPVYPVMDVWWQL